MNKLKSKQTLTLLITICKIHPNNEIRNQNLSPSNKSHYIYLYIFLRRCTYIGLRSFCKVPSAMAVPLGALKTSTIFLPTLSLHWFQRLWKQLYVCLNTKLEINLGFNITSLPINFMFTSMCTSTSRYIKYGKFWSESLEISISVEWYYIPSTYLLSTWEAIMSHCIFLMVHKVRIRCQHHCHWHLFQTPLGRWRWITTKSILLSYIKKFEIPALLSCEQGNPKQEYSKYITPLHR